MDQTPQVSALLWQLAFWLLQGLVLLGLFFVKREADRQAQVNRDLQTRVSAVSTDMHSLRLHLATNHPTKADMREAIALELAPLKQMLEGVAKSQEQTQDLIVQALRNTNHTHTS